MVEKSQILQFKTCIGEKSNKCYILKQIVRKVTEMLHFKTQSGEKSHNTLWAAVKRYQGWDGGKNKSASNWFLSPPKIGRFFTL